MTPHISSSRRRAGRPAKEGEEVPAPEVTAEEPKEEEERARDRETPRGGMVDVTCVGGDVNPPEGTADLPGFHPERAHLLLQGVYGDFPHHNDGSHLDRGIADDALWKRRWRRLAAQSASWYATPSGSLDLRFTEILTA